MYQGVTEMTTGDEYYEEYDDAYDDYQEAEDQIVSTDSRYTVMLKVKRPRHGNTHTRAIRHDRKVLGEVLSF